MKSILNLLVTIGIMGAVCTSCKKSSNKKLGDNFPDGVSKVLTTDILNKLKAAGATVNEGLTPPTVSGIYLFHPTYCTYDNSTDQATGEIFDDYRFRFTNQNTGAFTISAEYKDINSGTDFGGDNSATYISGSGNLFTIYAQTTGQEDGINNTQIQLISGEVASGSIKNLQLSTYLKSKGSDPDGDLVPVGTTRIFKDQDGVSGSQTTFSAPAQQVQNIGAGSAALRAILAKIHQ